MRLAFIVTVLAACDGGMTDPDAGTTVDCAGAADGTECGAAMICVGGACAESACGDGYVDGARGEECEDGNTVAFDGCDPGTCTFTCRDSAICSDGDPCNGDETCTVEHTCIGGTALPEGVDCTISDQSGTCRSSRCVVPGCLNGFLDDGEECDDDNVIDGDGCDSDCTFSCDLMTPCEDNNVCNGVAICQLADHTCSPGASPDCNDDDPCTNDVCDPGAGCQHGVAVDADMDGAPPTSLGACGTDCNDADDTIYPGATELCDLIDQDCDGNPAPLAPPTWYVDCDGDGYALPGARSMMQCDEPAPEGACVWTAREPAAGESDCDDGNAAIRPRAMEIVGDAADVDEDCDGSAGCYADADRDMARSEVEIASTDRDCTDLGEARMSAAIDCDDGTASIRPGAAEACNARDDDCDSMIDDGASCGSCDVASNAGRVYLLCHSIATWSSAQSTCRMFGYDLVRIDDMAENDFLAPRAFDVRDDDWWIGLNDRVTEGMYIWSDGTPLGFSMWTTGQPDNNGDQDCVFLADGSAAQEMRGRWNDFGCGNTRSFICEIP